MEIRELHGMEVGRLVQMAADLKVGGAGSLPRRELLFKVIRAQADNGSIVAEGVLEKLSDGYGFLRGPKSSYLPGPDDIYVSPSQIRRFDVLTGDTIRGQIRLPKQNERYFALAHVDSVNGKPPETARDRTRFDRLTPLYPQDRLRMEMPG